MCKTQSVTYSSCGDESVQRWLQSCEPCARMIGINSMKQSFWYRFLLSIP